MMRKIDCARVRWFKAAIVAMMAIFAAHAHAHAHAQFLCAGSTTGDEKASDLCGRTTSWGLSVVLPSVTLPSCLFLSSFETGYRQKSPAARNGLCRSRLGFTKNANS